MKNNGILAAILLILSISNAYACIDKRASYSAGVLFNNDEEIHFDKIMTMGSSGNNFNEYCKDYKIVGTFKDINIITNTDEPEIKKDMVRIENITIFGNMVALDLQYVGGCNEHDFALYAENSLSDSSAHTLSMKLSHNANGDQCEAMISETIHFSLNNIQPITSGHLPVKLIIKYPSADPAVFQTRTITWYPYLDCTFEYYRENSNNPLYLVSLEYFRDEYTNELFPSMRILLNPLIETFLPINMGNIVKSELEWLISKGIVTGIKSSTLETIASNIGTENLQHWTYQDSAIQYDHFFEYTIDSDGKYLWTRKTLNSTVDNCSSFYVFHPSTDPIDTSATPVINRASTFKSGTVSVSVNNQSCKVSLCNTSSPESTFLILDCKGRTVDKYKIPAGKKEFSFNLNKTPANGMYYAVYRTGSKILSKCRFMKY